MDEYDGWTILRELPAGRQAKVFVVRSPAAEAARVQATRFLLTVMKGQTPPMLPEHEALEYYIERSLPSVIQTLAAGDDDATLGVLKVFNVPAAEPARKKTLGRIELEVLGLRDHPHPNILRLLHANVEKHFIVTEYHPRGTVAQHRDLFKGDAVGAMTALLAIDDALRPLHKQGVIHRDGTPWAHR